MYLCMRRTSSRTLVLWLSTGFVSAWMYFCVVTYVYRVVCGCVCVHGCICAEVMYVYRWVGGCWCVSWMWLCFVDAFVYIVLTNTCAAAHSEVCLCMMHMFVVMYVNRWVWVCVCVCVCMNIFVYAHNFVTNTGAVALIEICVSMDAYVCVVMYVYRWVCGWGCTCVDVFVYIMYVYTWCVSVFWLFVYFFPVFRTVSVKKAALLRTYVMKYELRNAYNH